ncbi:MAG: LamG domain-containing protein [Proteobacteria bacterium]|nr:LamG domain-containing protein [Pseudomonadota bacterium]MBI3497854.1 LamG domain-containing protein [Pseudomonadota bacterium]
MAAVLGYADRQSLRAGEAIAFKVCCDGASTYRAEIVRLIAPEVLPGPDAPEFRFEAMASPADGEYEARHQDTPVGSYGLIQASPSFAAIGSFTLAAFLWPTTPGKGEQAVLGTWSRASGRGIGLHLDGDGAPMLVLGGGETISLGAALPARRWSFIAATYRARDRTVTLYQRQVETHHLDAADPMGRTVTAASKPLHGTGPLLIAAAAGGHWPDGRMRTVRHYNGKIERPTLLEGALTLTQLEALAKAGPARPAQRAAISDWDFSRGIDGERLVDRGRHRRHGKTVNLPTRAVTGSNWQGTRHDWQAAPEEYGAIHFHDDDLYDAGWQTSFRLSVPKTWKSGAYAARLTAGASEFWVPFFLRPARGAAKAKTAFLAPTCTYAAYANFRARVSGRWSELYHGRLTVLDSTDWLMQDYPEIGSSTYDVHSDGSLVIYSSMLRPVTNFRPTGRIYKFNQDMLILAWLERQGIAYDVVADDDLHREGIAALADYRCIITGSHPEYYTTAMLDGLEAFLGQGGRLIYLGGNGFYWRTAYHNTLRGVVEVRRAGQGFLGNNTEAESHMSFTGEVAGTWTRVGRPPQLIAGVGFITQGFDACEGYRLKRASRDPRAAFVFAGVEGEIVGDFGMLQNGAAGYEVDRADAALGTPVHALVLASSENHSNVYEISVPSFMDLVPKRAETAPDPIRADMVFFEIPGGGAVFSTGSIAWCGSLSARGYDNNVERITRNVLMRFVDAKPFIMPKPPSP